MDTVWEAITSRFIIQLSFKDGSSAVRNAKAEMFDYDYLLHRSFDRGGGVVVDATPPCIHSFSNGEDIPPHSFVSFVFRSSS